MQERQAETNAEMQLDTASSSGKEQRTNLTAYMTTVSEEVQNGADVNTDKEDVYHNIPDESDEYSYAYMDANSREDIQMPQDTKRSGNQASEDYYERVGNESGDNQDAYTALILEEIDKENHKETASQVYTQLKQDNRGNKQENVAEDKETETDAHDQFYANSKVVQNMKRVKRF